MNYIFKGRQLADVPPDGRCTSDAPCIGCGTVLCHVNDGGSGWLIGHVDAAGVAQHYLICRACSRTSASDIWRCGCEEAYVENVGEHCAWCLCSRDAAVPYSTHQCVCGRTTCTHDRCYGSNAGLVDYGFPFCLVCQMAHVPQTGTGFSKSELTAIVGLFGIFSMPPPFILQDCDLIEIDDKVGLACSGDKGMEYLVTADMGGPDTSLVAYEGSDFFTAVGMAVTIYAQRQLDKRTEVVRALLPITRDETKQKRKKHKTPDDTSVT